VERRCTQRDDGLERHVGVVLVVASPRHRSVIVAAAADGRTRQECGLELTTSSSPCPRGPTDGPPSRGAQQDGRLRVTESRAPQADPPEAVGGATSSRPPTFQWFRPPRLGLTAEASIAGEVDGLGFDAEHAAGGGFRRRPAAPSVVTYPGRQSPIHSCFPRRWRGPRTNPDRCRGRRISPRAVGGARCRR
jgi:hypothetical protein